MVIAAIVGFCILLLVLAFLVPRLSRGVQSGGHKTIGAGGRVGSKAPGPLGRLFSKSASTSQKAVGKSGSAGRKGRDKMPL